MMVELTDGQSLSGIDGGILLEADPCLFADHASMSGSHGTAVVGTDE